MRFRFRAFPAAGGGVLAARPIVDLAVEGLTAAPVACLVDTGAPRTRMSAEHAVLAGIDLGHSLTEPLVVGGVHTTGAVAWVGLTLSDGAGEHVWDAPVWFCDPWPFPFGLAGIEGFLHHFRVTISAYREYLEVVPESI